MKIVIIADTLTGECTMSREASYEIDPLTFAQALDQSRTDWEYEDDPCACDMCLGLEDPSLDVDD